MTAITGTIQLRKDTAANWTAANPTLLFGEIGIETDTSVTSIDGVKQYKTKYGDGTTAWNTLPYAILGKTITGATDTDGLAEGTTNLYFTYARVRATVLTGLSLVASQVIAATDTVLQALGYLQAQITALASTLSTSLTDIDCHGITDRAETTISFDGTNTFTIASVGASWSYYRSGTKCIITGNKSVVLPGTPVTRAKYYIYIDSTNGTLVQSTTSWTLNDTKVPVATINFNNTLTPKYWMADERHKISAGKWIEKFMHVIGTQATQLPVLTGYTVASDVDANKTVAISQAKILDKDYEHTIAAIAQPNGISQVYNSWYRDALTTWLWMVNEMPFPFAAASYIQWDNAGTLTTGIASRFYNSYLVISNLTGDGFMFIPGRAEFTSLANAQAEDPSTFDFTGFGIDENVICYQLTWETKVAYSSKGKCRLAVAPKAVNVTPSSSSTSITTLPASAVGLTAVNSLSSTNVQSAIEEMQGKTTLVGNAAYSILKTDKVVATSIAFAAPRIWTLPASATINAGYELIVVDEIGTVTSTNTLTIGVQSGEYLNGVLNGTEVMISASGFRRMINNGVNGWVFDAGIVRLSAAQTLTNKRFVSRHLTSTSATVAIDSDSYDSIEVTSLAATFNPSVSGTPTTNQKLIISVTDNGVAKAISLSATYFEASGILSLPTTTVASTRLMMGFLRNPNTNKWTIAATN